MQKCYTDKNIARVLTALAIGQSLIKLGPNELKIVVNQLENAYRCYLLDSYDHPEYLKKILQYLYVNEFDKIIDSVEKEFGILKNYQPYKEFLEVMRKPNFDC